VAQTAAGRGCVADSHHGWAPRHSMLSPTELRLHSARVGDDLPAVPVTVPLRLSVDCSTRDALTAAAPAPLQVRVVTYVVMGVLSSSEWRLYALTSAPSLLAMLAGNAVAGRMDQRAFSAAVVALMLLCCALMFASSLGLGAR
jgi:hypothetical protein